MTEDQQYCIEALEWLFLGAHHLPKVYEFGTGVCVNTSPSPFATTDFDRLTRMVLIGHAMAVRFEVGTSGPGMIKIIAHRRSHDSSGKLHQRHPTLDDLAKQAGEYKKEVER